MRLSKREIEIICTAFRKHFGLQDHLWLFGSRADPNKRGGDIDLYIETIEPNADVVVTNKLDFINDLWMKLGEQKIDVVINLISSHHDLPIYDVAKTEGIRLI